MAPHHTTPHDVTWHGPANAGGLHQGGEGGMHAAAEGGGHVGRGACLAGDGQETRPGGGLQHPLRGLHQRRHGHQGGRRAGDALAQQNTMCLCLLRRTKMFLFLPRRLANMYFLLNINRRLASCGRTDSAARVPDLKSRLISWTTPV